MPIVKVGNHVIGKGKVGPVTQVAMARFAEICHNYAKKRQKVGK